MSENFFIGVDGGATKCVVRIEDESGLVLGTAVGGPANIRLSVDEAWEAIFSAINAILTKNNLSLTRPDLRFHAGMGLAGCEVSDAYAAFLAAAHPFATLVLTSDAHTACLGAHAGAEGAILIAGTGVVGFQIEAGTTTKIGGFGFPHDDEGGGAWLGLKATGIALKSLDKRMPETLISRKILTHFDNDNDAFITWANQANSTAFAELAPMVIELAAADDPFAKAIMQEAALAIEQIERALLCAQQNQKTPLPCALVGGVAPFLIPYLSEALRSRLTSCKYSPDAGGILLIRQRLGAHAHG